MIPYTEDELKRINERRSEFNKKNCHTLVKV